MSKSKRFEPLLMLAERQERQGLQLLAQRLQALKATEDKITQLANYQLDYKKQMVVQGQSGISGAQVHQYQEFIHQIEGASEQQSEQKKLFKDQVEEARKIVEKLHQKTRMVELLIEKTKNKEKQLEQRQLQKELDEIAARLHKMSNL